MTSLEGRYRRLLAVYPVGHRQAYEREMLGVLMSGSRPGQRFPRLAEAADLMRAGLAARLAAARNAARSAAWRDAAAVVSLLTALLMVALTGGGVPFTVRMMFHGEFSLQMFPNNYGQPMAVTLLRPVAWLAVAVAILAGRRRTAAALGVVALVFELVRFAAWPPFYLTVEMHLAWAPVVIAVCVGTLFMAIGGRTAGQVLGRRGVALVAAGVVFGLAVLALLLPWWFYGSGAGYYGLPDPLLVVTMGLLLAGAAHGGRRVLVLMAPVLVVPLGHAVLWNVPHGNEVFETAALLIILIGLPIATFVAGLALLKRQPVSESGTEVK